MFGKREKEKGKEEEDESGVEREAREGGGAVACQGESFWSGSPRGAAKSGPANIGRGGGGGG